MLRAKPPPGSAPRSAEPAAHPLLPDAPGPTLLPARGLSSRMRLQDATAPAPQAARALVGSAVFRLQHGGPTAFPSLAAKDVLFRVLPIFKQKPKAPERKFPLHLPSFLPSIHPSLLLPSFNEKGCWSQSRTLHRERRPLWA